MGQRLRRRPRRRGGAVAGRRGHLFTPPPRRMRGSSSASAMSDRNTPTTVNSARNMRNEPARYMRSEEHTSELQSLMRISYAVFCLKKKKKYIYKERRYN